MRFLLLLASLHWNIICITPSQGFSLTGDIGWYTALLFSKKKKQFHSTKRMKLRPCLILISAINSRPTDESFLLTGAAWWVSFFQYLSVHLNEVLVPIADEHSESIVPFRFFISSLRSRNSGYCKYANLWCGSNAGTFRLSEAATTDKERILSN